VRFVFFLLLKDYPLTCKKKKENQIRITAKIIPELDLGTAMGDRNCFRFREQMGDVCLDSVLN
jgi:hypothetical protein